VEAKDTVMSPEEIEKRWNIHQPTLVHGGLVNPLLEAQAERTESMLKEQWRRVGIKEVVDGIKIYDKNYADNDWGNSKFRESLLWYINNNKKEWGIDDHKD